MSGLHAPHRFLNLNVVKIRQRIPACSVCRNPPAAIIGSIKISMPRKIDQYAVIRLCRYRQVPQFHVYGFFSRFTVQKKLHFESVFLFKDLGHACRIVYGRFKIGNLRTFIIVNSDDQRFIFSQFSTFVGEFIDSLYLNRFLRAYFSRFHRFILLYRFQQICYSVCVNPHFVCCYNLSVSNIDCPYADLKHTPSPHNVSARHNKICSDKLSELGNPGLVKPQIRRFLNLLLDDILNSSPLNNPISILYERVHNPVFNMRRDLPLFSRLAFNYSENGDLLFFQDSPVF